MLSKDTKRQQRLYKEFMAEEGSEEISQVFEQNKLPSILGRREKIKQVICRIYGVRVEDLLKSKRGTFNEPRSVAIYLTRQLRGENLAEICREYGLSKYSSASSVIERMGTKMSTDRQLRKRVAKISQVLTKSQAESR